ncbi:hypothetical protein [Deinococcus cellulosilyticus]|uniref:Uncharacterized protein n=1 Tax=Deinococcus cellulosilyticus (strain DSM 18568 / NBRC 106333 / KACC 11606 / 5516J-15) TaxID=1223518 RepID=A0A511N9D3_DEIC1|nr:hypothetical protein [Deinococcus cellulosilyticus]GEM49449.1 hypothetical protein DC3_50840 [Deinococcus cellulosilyticus NBRC 106333 = KACC 11606]
MTLWPWTKHRSPNLDHPTHLLVPHAEWVQDLTLPNPHRRTDNNLLLFSLQGDNLRRIQKAFAVLYSPDNRLVNALPELDSVGVLLTHPLLVTLKGENENTAIHDDLGTQVSLSKDQLLHLQRDKHLFMTWPVSPLPQSLMCQRVQIHHFRYSTSRFGHLTFLRHHHQLQVPLDALQGLIPDPLGKWDPVYQMS